MPGKLSHIRQGKPAMVDVSAKAVTRRVAEAEAVVWLAEAAAEVRHQELQTAKGPVFQTAILAGVMAAKRTSELIPLCHPLPLEDCQIAISLEGDVARIHVRAVTSGKTGVEMEALTAASVAALTIYDMCKGITHQLVIREVRLLSKTGGKSNFKREKKG